MHLHLKKTHILALALFLASVAFATEFSWISGQAGWAKVGFWVGPVATQAVAGNRVKNISMGAADIVFPALAPDAGLYHDNCGIGVTSVGASTITATGAQVGDPCSIGLKAPAPSSPTRSSYHCRVSAAGVVTPWRCTGSIDGLAVEDAGVIVFVPSNQ